MKTHHPLDYTAPLSNAVMLLAVEWAPSLGQCTVLCNVKKCWHEFPTYDLCNYLWVRNQCKSLCFHVLSKMYENNSKHPRWEKHLRRGNTSIIPVGYWICLGEHVSVTQKRWTNKGLIMTKRPPQYHQHIKRTVGFITFQRKQLKNK